MSILSAMDDSPSATHRPRLSPGPLWPWLGGGLLAALGLIWLANTQESGSHQPQLITSAAASNTPISAPTAASLAVAAVPAASAVIDGAASVPAVIEVTVAAPSPLAASSASPTAAPSAAQSSEVPALVAAGVGTAAVGALVASRDRPSSPPPKTSKRTKAKAEREATKVATKSTVGDRKASSSVNPPSSNADPDVDLIAAVMGHGESRSTGRAGDPDADSTSIASLVSRCKRLSGTEARACRQNLCEGYWGKAEACPKRLAPKATSKRKKKKKSAANDTGSKA